MHITIEDNDFEWGFCKDAEAFYQRYPKPVKGKYRPQPWLEPKEFPCLIKELGIMHNDNGADYYILDYIYNFATT